MKGAWPGRKIRFPPVVEVGGEVGEEESPVVRLSCPERVGPEELSCSPVSTPLQLQKTLELQAGPRRTKVLSGAKKAPA